MQTEKMFQRFVVDSDFHAIGRFLLTLIETLQEDDKPFEVRLSDESFETYELDPPSYTLTTTKKELKQMYYDMQAIRYYRIPRWFILRGVGLIRSPGDWKWMQIDCIRKKRSEGFVICLQGKKL